MLAKVCSAAVNGIEAYPVEVEVNAGYGDTLIVIVVNKTPKAFAIFFGAPITVPELSQTVFLLVAQKCPLPRN